MIFYYNDTNVCIIGYATNPFLYGILKTFARIISQGQSLITFDSVTILIPNLLLEKRGRKYKSFSCIHFFSIIYKIFLYLAKFTTLTMVLSVSITQLFLSSLMSIHHEFIIKILY